MMDAFATLGSADVSAKDTFDALVSEFNDIRDMVPGDLKEDIDVLAEAYGRYGELLAQAEDDPNIFADPDFMAEFDSIMMTDEFNAANERFTNWINTECAVGS
jgi:hypothetical protein